MKRRKQSAPARLLAAMWRTTRVGLFGATRPLRALVALFSRPVEVIAPAEADRRAIFPAEPPEEFVEDLASGRREPSGAAPVNPELTRHRQER